MDDLRGTAVGSANGVQAGNTGTIMGSVRTLDNQPVANARVEVSSLGNGQVISTQYTTGDGSFMVSNLRSGRYEIKAESGIAEAGDQIQVGEGESWLTVRMPSRDGQQSANAGGATVSVRQMQVPKKAESFLDKAHDAMAKNNLDDVNKYVSKALDAYPQYSEALAMRAIVELQRQKYEQAGNDANRAIQNDPSNGMAYLVMGAIFNAQRKYDDAVRELGRAEALLPNAWQGYFESSKALLHLGKFTEALQQASRGVALVSADGHPELHLVKGYAYIGLHAYTAAITELEAYVNQAPAGPDALEAHTVLAKIRPLAAANPPANQ